MNLMATVGVVFVLMKTIIISVYLSSPNKILNYTRNDLDTGPKHCIFVYKEIL